MGASGQGDGVGFAYEAKSAERSWDGFTDLYAVPLDAAGLSSKQCRRGSCCLRNMCRLNRIEACGQRRNLRRSVVIHGAEMVVVGFEVLHSLDQNRNQRAISETLGLQFI